MRPAARQPWPKTLAERTRAVQRALTAHVRPATAAVVAGQFSRARKTDVAAILETLAALGLARVAGGGRYGA